MAYNFAPASSSEDVVYGACRPCYHQYTSTDDTVQDWIDFMNSENIDRVCCLLDEGQLVEYDKLLQQYRDQFGAKNVCHAPIQDFSTVSRSTLYDQILPFLDQSDDCNQKVVVHCSAGSGRTGHVLALWLHLRRGYTLVEAISKVEQMGRNPLEATTLPELKSLIGD